MKIEKLKKKNNNQYTIVLSDNTSLSFYDDTILHFNLIGKKEIDSAYLQEIAIFNEKYEAYYLALKDIKIKLRTEEELRAKLKKKNYKKENIDYAIMKLKDQGFINNDLYMKSYIADQVNLSTKGPKRIENELRKLGFNEKIDLFIGEYPDEVWLEKIDKIIAKKQKSNHNLSIAMLKNKIKKELMNMGYEQSWIEKGLNKVTWEDTREILEKEVSKEYRKLSRKYAGAALKNKLKYNLYKKGFSLDTIEECIKNIED